MALGDSYATLTDLKARFSIADSVDDAQLSAALDAASRSVESFCDRQFNDAFTASVRQFRATTPVLLVVDDFSTADGLTVTVSGTVLEAGAYTAEPFGPGPFWKLRTVGVGRWPVGSVVEVSARWGWAAVPAPVKEATLIIAAELFKLKDAPFGVAGFGEFGVVRVRDNPKAASLLYPYRPTGPRVL
ncbi:phage head-tail connector protein [Saccharopolyspora hattusasensis]|uniref:phage head-tail connector protein n=1 Tax=Saccharopolyspora hattusasensis TaxID=1128679 RepID=UPI003D98DF67